MAEFQFKCSHCGETVVADETSIGETAECPFCNKVIMVPNKQENGIPEAPSLQHLVAMFYQSMKRVANAKRKSIGILCCVIITLVVFFSIITCSMSIITRPERNYQNTKRWYENQLEYNGLSELYFMSYPSPLNKNRIGGYILDLSGNSGTVTIRLDGSYISYPRSMAVGFAKDLMNARITIYNYESAHKMLKNH